MSLACLSIETIWFDGRVVSKSLHVRAPIWCILANLKLLIDISIRALLEKEYDLPERCTVNVELSQVVRAKEELTIGFSGQGLELRQSLRLVLRNLLHVLPSAQNDAKHVGQELVEPFHLEAHLGGLQWVARDQLDARVRARFECIVDEYARVWDQFALGGLHHGCSAAIDIDVPLCLIVQINLAVLERDLLGRESVASSCRERTQVVIVDPDVVRVCCWFG